MVFSGCSCTILIGGVPPPIVHQAQIALHQHYSRRRSSARWWRRPRCWRWWSRGGRRRASSRWPPGARSGCCRPRCSSAPARRSAVRARPVFIISFTKCFNPVHYSVRFVVLALGSTTRFGYILLIWYGNANANIVPPNTAPNIESNMLTFIS